MNNVRVGSIVTFNEDGFELAAIVTYVWDQNTVNLCVFSKDGDPGPRTFVSRGEGYGEFALST